MSHDSASAVGSDMLEYTPASTLLKVKPPIVNEPLQSCGVVGVMIPSESAASATIGLNVEPVGYCPCVAWFSSRGLRRGSL